MTVQKDCRRITLVCALILSALNGCEQARLINSQRLTAVSAVSYEDHFEPIQPLSAIRKPMGPRATLGKLLFHDERLSHDNSISCATCHNVHHGGDDDQAFSHGIGGAAGVMNSPTVLNSSLNMAQFWDGRVSSLKEQVAGPIHAPNEMASNWAEVVSKLKADPELTRRFQKEFSEGITPDTISECIANYEEQLLTPDAPFDRFLRGEKTAVNDEVLEGYRLFRELGCAACHQGRGIGGNLFVQFGVMRKFIENELKLDGQSQAKTLDSHISHFHDYSFSESRLKVPMLRNVALTAPYLHDGSAETLEDAVEVMGIFQLGTELTEHEVRLLVTFLKSLTGVLDEELK